MSDMFATATTVKAPVAAPSVSNALPVSQNLEIITAIDTITDSFKAVREFHEQELKKEVRPEYLRRGMKICRQPDNLKLEGPQGSTCSAIWQKRTSSSVLSKDEIKSLDVAGIPQAHKTVVTQQAIEERFFFNSELLADAHIRELISTALAGIPELAGKEVIQRQPAVAEVKKEVVTDDCISEVFKLEDPEMVSKMMRIVSISVFKAQGSGSLEEAFRTLEKAGLDELINKSKVRK